MRLIDSDALIDFLDETVPYEEMLVSQYNADWIYSFIECAPTIEARPVVRGEWQTEAVHDYDGFTVFDHIHRECGYYVRNYLENGDNFCPNCGADMRKGEDDG